MKIIIKGTPIAKNRHRCGCTGNRAYAYDPQVSSEMKTVRTAIWWAWNQASGSKNSQIAMEASNLTQAESFEVGFTFIFPINDRAVKGQKNAKLWGLQSPNVKPDFDNLEKFYADCATGILWHDDCQVVVSHSKKVYGENPRTEIDIMVKQDLKLKPLAEDILMILSPSKLKDFLGDVSAFWMWPASRVDEVIPLGEEPNKSEVLNAMSELLLEFAVKHADDLKKIKKITIKEKI